MSTITTNETRVRIVKSVSIDFDPGEFRYSTSTGYRRDKVTDWELTSLRIEYAFDVEAGEWSLWTLTARGHNIKKDGERGLLMPSSYDLRASNAPRVGTLIAEHMPTTIVFFSEAEEGAE